MNGKLAKLVRNHCAYLLSKGEKINAARYRQIKREAVQGGHRERHALRRAWAKEFSGR